MTTDFAADGWTDDTSADDVHVAEHQALAEAVNALEDAPAGAGFPAVLDPDTNAVLTAVGYWTAVPEVTIEADSAASPGGGFTVIAAADPTAPVGAQGIAALYAKPAGSSTLDLYHEEAGGEWSMVSEAAGTAQTQRHAQAMDGANQQHVEENVSGGDTYVRVWDTDDTDATRKWAQSRLTSQAAYTEVAYGPSGAPTEFLRMSVNSFSGGRGFDMSDKPSITGATTQEQVDSIVAALVNLGLATDDR